MKLIDEILSSEIFVNHPPVFIDIGASGQIHHRWKKLAKYSICIAFDADNRDLEYSRKESKDYKELYVINSIVDEKESDNVDFYLTEHPHCSSTLYPEIEKLKSWSYFPKFRVVDKIKTKATTINKTLEKLQLNYIDWIKSDAQGLDLRIFKSIEEKLRNRILIAEFEPGIMSAYVNEDKMYSVLEYMDKEDIFWMSEFILKGAQKMNSDLFNKMFPTPFKKKIAEHTLRKSPGWAEMIYLNTFDKSELQTERNLLLGWIISTLQNQHGFSHKLAQMGKDKFGTLIFDKLLSKSASQLKRSTFSIKLISPLFNKIGKALKV